MARVQYRPSTIIIFCMIVLLMTSYQKEKASSRFMHPVQKLMQTAMITEKNNSEQTLTLHFVQLTFVHEYCDGVWHNNLVKTTNPTRKGSAKNHVQTDQGTGGGGGDGVPDAPRNISYAHLIKGGLLFSHFQN